MEFHPLAKLNGVHTKQEVEKLEIRNPFTEQDKQYMDGLSYFTPKQVQSFKDTGVLIVRREQMWSDQEFDTLISSVNEMDSWPDQAGKWMKYYEKNLIYEKASEEERAKLKPKILQRIENFTQFNPALDGIVNGHKVLGMCSQLFGEPSILYKEKINYKLPGGGGFNPHQDVSAGWWMYGQSLHISVLMGIDEATVENGCLEVVYCKHKLGKLAPEWKELGPEVVDSLTWELVPTKPGDVIFFDSYVPHRSAANLTNKPRRVLYSTYAKALEGDWRDRYYSDKRKSFPPDIEREAGKVYEYKV